MSFRAKKNRRRIEVTKTKADAETTASPLVSIFRKVLGVLVAMAAMGFGGYGLFQWASQSPRFAIATVTFRGNTHASDAELLRMGGVGLGQNLLGLDVLALERLLGGHPWVKEARVQRHFPRSLKIQITEHRPVAMVSLGDLYLVDEDGEPFKRVMPSDALNLPIVTGIEREDYVAHHAQTLARLAEALGVAHSYSASPSGKSAPLSEVHLTDNAVTLITADGERVQLGEGGWREKLGRLARVRQALKARALSAAVIRLDNRARPSSVTVSLQINHSSTGLERGAPTGK